MTISRFALTLLCVLVLPGAARAQHPDHAAAPAAPEWAWQAKGQAFVGANLQVRKFTDFHQVESQNWFMGAGARRVGAGTLALHGMVSLEPFTLRDLGSSQVFQTGETFGGAPLIDYQHPHDLFMALAARYERPVGRSMRVLVGGGLVDAPALGPTAFMHRRTASLHPTAPLGHHQVDATHITHGVVTAGLGAGPWLVEGSVFRGAEPDEDRLDLDLGALDSWSTRVSYRAGGLYLQASGARLDDPDVLEPGDVTRLTASVEWAGRVRDRDVALTLAVGQNRERFGNEDAYLAELTAGLGRRGTAYLRGELVDKHILEAGGLHPPGFEHPHILSTVGALTVGYAHQLSAASPWGAVSVGGDITGYRTPEELAEPYGRPVSIHLYLRWSR